MNQWESLWVGIRGQTNTGGIVLGVCSRYLHQDKETDKTLFRQLEKASQPQVLIHRGNCPRGQSWWLIYKDRLLRAQNSSVQKIEQMCQMSMMGHEAWIWTQRQKGNMHKVEKGIQRHRPHMQEWSKESQSSAAVETSEEGEQKKDFYVCIGSKREVKENAGLFLADLGKPGDKRIVEGWGILCIFSASVFTGFTAFRFPRYPCL